MARTIGLRSFSLPPRSDLRSLLRLAPGGVTGFFAPLRGQFRDWVRGRRPTVPGTAATPSFLGAAEWRAMANTQTAHACFDFGSHKQYGTTGSFSVIASVRPRIQPSTGGNTSAYYAVTTINDVALPGWAFGFTENNPPTNVTLYVYNGASYEFVSAFGVGGVTAYGSDSVIGARYETTTGRAAVFQNGKRLASSTLSTGCNATFTTNGLRVGGGGWAGFNDHFDGDIRWVAVFPTAVSDATMAWWGRQRRLLDAMAEAMSLAPTVGDVPAFSTGITVGSTVTPATAAVFSTSVGASGGGTPDVARFETDIGVGAGTVNAGLPTLLNFLTICGVRADAAGGGLTPGAPVTHTTTVSASAGGRRLRASVPGQAGRLASGKYRR